jgi:hypothetical protein
MMDRWEPSGNTIAVEMDELCPYNNSCPTKNITPANKPVIPLETSTYTHPKRNGSNTLLS